nr:aldehyde dehydrogenase family protein [Sphingomicrobium sediminis]
MLIDVQEEFLSREGLEPTRVTFEAALGDTLTKARAVGLPVVHVRTRLGKMPHRAGLSNVEAGQNVPEKLESRDGEPVFWKDAFGGFDAPGLERHLRAEGIRELVLAGLHAHACIRETATQAYARGFKVELLESAIASDAAEHGKAALAWLDARGMAQVGHEAITPGETLPPLPLEELRDAQRERADLSERQRSQTLSNWQERIEDSGEELIASMVEELHKPVRDAEGELRYAMALLEAAAQQALTAFEPGKPQLFHAPRGIIAAITPWNNPLALAIGKIAPALAFGNAVLWKPAPQAARLSRKLHETLGDLTPLVALVEGGADVGRRITSAEVDAISFTGSVPNGYGIIASAAQAAIPVQAELGGSNVAIVGADAKIEDVAADLARAIFSFAGQRCTALRRILVDKAIEDDFREALVTATDQLVIGDPADAKTEMGPMLDAAARQALSERIASALAEGATLVSNDRDLPAGENWMAPTLLTNVPDTSDLKQVEAFGPVAMIDAYSDLDKAIERANATPYGLLAATFGFDLATQDELADALHYGMVSHDAARPPFSANGPFSGWKASGYGPPEHGRWNRDFYARVQARYS